MERVDDILNRIRDHKGVLGYLIVNSEGIPVRSILDNSTTVQYTALLHTLTAKARNVVRDLEPSNDLQILRIRTKKHEIMIVPDGDYIVMVIQNV